jgi:hypothetical protein
VKSLLLSYYYYYYYYYFAAADVDINRDWETIRENIKISAKEGLGYYELEKHKLWFDERCSELLDQREQAKLQWLQDPSEIMGII